jgi:hypothetical protein
MHAPISAKAGLRRLVAGWASETALARGRRRRYMTAARLYDGLRDFLAASLGASR